MVTFKAANKKQQKLRLAIMGLAGSGKTFSALRIATGMGKRIAVIDSEHSSSELYANRFQFDICSLNTYEIEEYVEAIESAGASGYDVIIIDSLTHAWEKLLERVDRIAEQRYRGNTFRAWSEGSELQKKLIEAILDSPCHVIGTIRTKAEYAVDSDSGKTKVTKLGTAPKQREGFEYELSLVMELSAKHVGFISKDRTGKFQDKYIELPGEDFGKKLIEWLNEGAVLPPPPPPASTGTPPASAKTAGRQYNDAIAEIANIITSEYESGEPVFTDAEKQKVRAQLQEFPKDKPDERVKFAKWLLDGQKKTMVERISFFAVTHKSNEPPPADSAPINGEGGSTVASMYDEPENQGDLPQNGEYPFEDDIPDWDEKSVKKGQKATAKKAADKEPATAGASEEPDIY